MVLCYIDEQLGKLSSNCSNAVHGKSKVIDDDEMTRMTRHHDRAHDSYFREVAARIRMLITVTSGVTCVGTKTILY